MFPEAGECTGALISDQQSAPLYVAFSNGFQLKDPP